MATIYWNQGIDNIANWVGMKLPELYPHWAEPDTNLRKWLDEKPGLPEACNPAFSQQNFDAFVGRFTRITISSGLPRNDYGQTIELAQLDPEEIFPASNYTWGDPPFEQDRALRFLSPAIFFKHQEDQYRSKDTIVFSAVGDFQWRTLEEAVIVSRWLSMITTYLDGFELAWGNEKIKVRIHSKKSSRLHRPPFSMHS